MGQKTKVWAELQGHRQGGKNRFIFDELKVAVGFHGQLMP
jgi:hypothetical protein